MRRGIWAGLMMIVMVVVPSRSLDAQVCSGMAPFENGRMQVGGLAQFADGAQAYGGMLSLGRPDYFFGSFGFGAVTYDDLDGASTTVSGAVGYQVGLGATQTLQLCPIASASLGFGPNDIMGSDVDASFRDFSFGVGLGGTLHGTPQFQVIPAGAVSFAHSTLKFDDGVDSESDSDTFGIVSLGVGLVFNRVFTLRPGMSLPFGLDESDPVWGIALGLSFGGQR
jgi:hypothetical protein